MNDPLYSVKMRASESGADISGERQSARGRADAVLQDKAGTYVFEFKYGKTAKEALDQAKTKEYGNPWLDSSLPVFYVGVNYDPEKRGIDDPLVEGPIDNDELRLFES